MTLGIFHLKGIDFLGEDGKDSSEDKETSTDDTDKQTDNKFKCSETNNGNYRSSLSYGCSLCDG